MQEGFVFHSIYEPASPAYVIQLTCSCTGDVDPALFRQTWMELSRRHAVLRTSFVHEGVENPVQVVLRERCPEFTYGDLTDQDPESAEAQILDHRRRDHERGFDLQHDVLMRIALFRLGNQDFRIVWSFHHILMDGWSYGILQHEFVEIYSALSRGMAIPLQEPAAYADFIRYLDRRDSAAAVTFWRQYLAGFHETTSLPRLAGGDRAQVHELRDHTFEVDRDLTLRLKQLAARYQVTLNTVCQAVWGLLLSRWNSTDEVVFGAVVSGRPSDLPRVAEMVGVFINTIPVRVQLAGDACFHELLALVQRRALECEPHQLLPLADIQTVGESGGGLFDHVMTFENYPLDTKSAEDETPSGLPFSMQLSDIHDRTHYDFSVLLVPGESIPVRFDYDAGVYSPEQMEQTGQHFLRLLNAACANPVQRLSEMDMLSPAERRLVTQEFSHGPRHAAPTKNVVERFLQQVELRPDAAALVYADNPTTYRQLDIRSARVAAALRTTHGVRGGDRVAIQADRSPDLVAGIMGILRSGAAFVPVSLNDPIERVRQILDDSGADVLLTDDDRFALSEDRGEVAVVNLEAVLRDEGSGDPASFCSEWTAESDLAYVMYTSGSTGVPKGCQIGHDNLMSYLAWADSFYFADKEQGDMPLFSSIGFDLTITSLLLPLIRGRCIHVYSDQDELIDVLSRVFEAPSGVHGVKLTPSHISLLHPMDLAATDISVAIVGGEALLPEHVRTLHRLNPNMRIYNEYGPTEATVGCIVQQVHVTDERILIGRPIDNCRVLVLDDRRRFVPVGATGEIHLGGPGVSRGYLNRPELTADAFVADPLNEGETLYRTGDLGRWLPDGTMEYRGRRDHQVKIRGHRVELQEIESRLVDHESIDGAVVGLRRAAGSGEVLVAWLIARDSVDPSALQTRLRESLPEHMIPQRICCLEEFPLTANGKVDKAALPNPGGLDESGKREHAKPRNDLEERLLSIWQDILGSTDFGTNDDFFELGGHSLKAMQVQSRIRKLMDVKLPLQTVFRNPTIAGLAQAISNAEVQSLATIPFAAERSDYQLSHAQQRLWLLHQMQGDVAYNMPKALRFDRPLSMTALQASFERIIERHEALRTAFVLVDGEPRQKIVRDVDFCIQEYDVSHEQDPEAAAQQLATQAANEPFDLQSPPLLRAAVIRLPNDNLVIVLVIHHIIGDGWSMTVLYHELLSFYASESDGLPNSIAPLGIQYKDFSEWQKSHSFEKHERYWLQKLSGMNHRVDLPYDRPASTERDFRGSSETLEWDSQTTEGIRRIARRHDATTSDVVLTLLNLLLYRLTQSDDICIGVSVACRNHPDLERLIGFFVNVLPLRTRFSDNMEFDDLLAQVSQNSRESLEYQEYPFDRLVQAINPQRTANRQPLVNVIYGYQNFEDVRIDGTSDETPAAVQELFESSQPFGFEFETSKFDLTLYVHDYGDNIVLTLEYDTGLFLPRTISGYLTSLQQFAQMVAGVAQTQKAGA